MHPATETSRASVLATSSLFAHISIAIIDRDIKVAALVKKILYGLGCKHIYIAHDGMEVLQLMREELVDIIITDWETKTIGALDLTSHIRRSPDSPNPLIPILMLTGRSSAGDITSARDAGVTEYLVKPFSAKSLLDRIYAIVENPRGFVVCKSFIGPDRRRISSLSLPKDPNDTQVIERRPPIIVSRAELRPFELDDTPRMTIPDYSLKKKLDAGAGELITGAAALAASESVIEDAGAEFMALMQKDVTLLEQSYNLLIQHPDHAKRLILSIREACYSIKSSAGLFGYSRASEVAELLYHFCQTHYDENNKYHLIIIEKHIHILTVIFNKKIKGDGGEVGRLLVADMGKLTDKYLNRKD